MSLSEKTLELIKTRRERLINGGINSIPTPFKRFKNDFVGLEQGCYYLITSFTKGAKSQFFSNLLFEAIMYCYYNEKKTGVTIKVLYFPLEETDIRIMLRFQSWLLFKYTHEQIRISPADLKSSNNEKPVPQEVIDLLETDEIKDIINYFEEAVIIKDTETNPTGIYKTVKDFVKERGVIHTREKKYKDDLGNIRTTEGFDYYTANNPNEYVFMVIDTINLLQLERGFTKKQTIDKMSDYCVELRNYYNVSPIIIQQQNAENENIESIKLNRNRPSIVGLEDSKRPGKDCNIAFGIFSPARFGLSNCLNYNIDILQDHFRALEVIISRDGEMGGIIGLFFDGATCTWKELPPAEDVENMIKVYSYLEKFLTPEDIKYLRKKLKK